MSKLKLFLISAILTFIMLPVMIVNAESIDVGDTNTFNTYAQAGGTIKLINDITITENTFIKNDLKVDLNGHNLNMDNSTLVIHDKLTVEDKSSSKEGKITGTASFIIQIGGSDKVGNFILNSGTIEANGSYGIRIVK